MYEYELVLSREAAGRLLALAEEGRPAFLSASRVQGQKKHRLCVWQVAPSPPPATGDQEGRGDWMEIPSPREFIASFDILKVFSGRGIRVITAGRARLERDYTARFARLLQTYGRDDPLSQLTVGVVGLGRLGSKVIQGLAEQGVRRFVLVDPQTVEAANQQLAVYSWFPIGIPKVEAIKEWLKPYAQEVITIQKSIWVLDDREWALFADLDLILLCVDNALTRLVACQHAMRAGIPIFEGGVHIDAGNPPRLLGRIQTAIPGRWCLFCLPEAADLEGAAQELDDIERTGRLRSTPRPADPTLSEWIAAGMVLISRQALRGGGIAPRYAFQLAAGGTLVRGETPRIVPQCRYCRPSPALADVWPRVRPAGSGSTARRLRRQLTRLAEPLPRLLERAATWTGAAVGGFLGAAVALGIAIGLLVAIRHMIGFWGYCSWRGCSGFPNPLHFLWYFWDEYYYDHHTGHFFGLLWSMFLMLSLPYLLLGLPIFGMRWGYEATGRPFTRRRARRALQGVFQGLEALRERWPPAPQLRVHPIIQRSLQRCAQGLAIIMEVAAASLLIPIFRALPLWLFLGLYMLILYLTWGIILGVRYNHRAIARFIERLCRMPIRAYIARLRRGRRRR